MIKKNSPFLANFRLVSSLEQVEVGRQRAGGENAGVALWIERGAEEHVVAEGRVLDPGSLSSVRDGPVDLSRHKRRNIEQRQRWSVVITGEVRDETKTARAKEGGRTEAATVRNVGLRL